MRGKTTRICARRLLRKNSLSFAGLVVLARSLNPIPSRTRPLNSSAPMVLWLKPWESRSLPGLPRTKQFLFRFHDQKNAVSLAQHAQSEAAFFVFGSRPAQLMQPCPVSGGLPEFGLGTSIKP